MFKRLFFSVLVIYGSLMSLNAGDYYNGKAKGEAVALFIKEVSVCETDEKAIIKLNDGGSDRIYRFNLKTEYGKMMYNTALSAFMGEKKVYVWSADPTQPYEVWAKAIYVVN
jgi:hypothetical protein